MFGQVFCQRQSSRDRRFPLNARQDTKHGIVQPMPVRAKQKNANNGDAATPAAKEDAPATDADNIQAGSKAGLVLSAVLAAAEDLGPTATEQFLKHHATQLWTSTKIGTSRLKKEFFPAGS